MNADSHCLNSDYRRLTRLLPRCLYNFNLKPIGLAMMLIACAGQAIAQDQVDAPECKCRSPDGEMQDLGTVQCVNIVGRNRLVRCEMSTNTPYWNKVDGVTGCPDA